MGDSIGGALSTVALLVFVALPGFTALTNLLFLPRGGPWWTFAHAKRVLRRHGLAVAAVVAMLVPENLESLVDPKVTAALPWRDAPTAFIASYEHGFHAWLQSLPGLQALTPLWAAIYLLGFPYLIVAATTHAVWLDDGVRARRAAGAYALCFAFALPFYLFLPVNEVWCHYGSVDAAGMCQNDGAVQQLAMRIPFVRANLYAFNEINNCFPSLHTAIPVALALVSRGVPRFGRFAAVLAGLIVFTTQALGIHWLTDVAAGLLLAFAVNRLVRRIWPDPPTPAATPTPLPPPAGAA
jgi:hypothetical protein